MISFEKSISTNEIFLNIHYYLSQYFLLWKKYFFGNFDIYEHNIISVEFTKVLGQQDFISVQIYTLNMSAKKMWGSEMPWQLSFELPTLPPNKKIQTPNTLNTKPNTLRPYQMCNICIACTLTMKAVWYTIYLPLQCPRIWFFNVEPKPINIVVNQRGANTSQKMLWIWLFHIHKFNNFINIAFLVFNSRIILLFDSDPRTPINTAKQVKFVSVFAYVFSLCSLFFCYIFD